MSLINCEDAARLAMRRLVKVLREQLATEAAAINDLGLPIPVPPAAAYYRLGTEDDMVKVLEAHGAACFIVPTSPNVEQDARTGSATVHGRLDKTQWRIIFLFKRYAGHDPVVIDGYEISQTEAVWELADRLRGAAQLTLFKHAPNTDAIHAINVDTTLADYLPLVNGALTGRAVLEVTVTQDVLVPQPARTIP